MSKKLDNQRHRVEQHIEKAKTALARDVAEIIDGKQGGEKMTQTQASYLTGEAPSQISLVCTGKLRGFSMERLLRMRAMLRDGLRVVIGKKTVVIGK